MISEKILNKADFGVSATIGEGYDTIGTPVRIFLNVLSFLGIFGSSWRDEDDKFGESMFSKKIMIKILVFPIFFCVLT